MAYSKLPNIKRSKKFDGDVQRLCTEKEEPFTRTLFPTIREFMCFCALLGYSEDKRLPLDRALGVEDIANSVFEQGEAEEVVFMIALAESKDSEILKPGREGEAVLIFEEYACGGMTIVSDWLKRDYTASLDIALQNGLRQLGYVEVDVAQPFDASQISF